MDREALEAVLGFRVLSWPGPYVTAFTHKTGCKYVNGESFEKLEFLGDAVLGFIVGRYLFDMYPDQNEGFLSQMRTKLVSGKALAAIADRSVGFWSSQAAAMVAIGTATTLERSRPCA